MLFRSTHAFLPMIERRRGGVLQVASLAAYQPTPYFAVYGATKAFVLSFGEALWAEYKDRGVRVVTVSPGATDTGFFSRAGEEASAGVKRVSPEGVARLGLEALRKNKPSVVHGFTNTLATVLLRFFPRAFTARVMGWLGAPSPREMKGRSSPAVR